MSRRSSESTENLDSMLRPARQAEQHWSRLSQTWDWVLDRLQNPDDAVAAEQPFLVASRILTGVAGREELDSRSLLAGTRLRSKSWSSSERNDEKPLEHELIRPTSDFENLKKCLERMEEQNACAIARLRKKRLEEEPEEIKLLRKWLKVYEELPENDKTVENVIITYLSIYFEEHGQTCPAAQMLSTEEGHTYNDVTRHWAQCTASQYNDCTFEHVRGYPVDQVKENLGWLTAHLRWYSVHNAEWNCSRRGVPIAGHVDITTASSLASFCEIMGIPYWFEPDTSHEFVPQHLDGESEDSISTRDEGSDVDSDWDPSDELMDSDFESAFDSSSSS